MKRKVMFIFGTRPEAIKLAPLIRIFKSDPNFETVICVTAQHREMLDQVLDFFSILPDSDLNLMVQSQNVDDLLHKVVKGTAQELAKYKPELIFVQGDTTTVLGAATAAKDAKILIAHVEAGLRSHNLESPFPEEINRVNTSIISTFHFCPTEIAKQNLLNEGYQQHVVVTGNTVIDALLNADELVTTYDSTYSSRFNMLDHSRRIVLITCHRRESFGEPLLRIMNAIVRLADLFSDVDFIFPVHPNPNVKEIAERELSRKNILLLEPLHYPELVWIMKRSAVILTDSGGIQEEAPTFHKLSIVMRDVTERMEGVDAGTSILVGTDADRIVQTVYGALNDSNLESRLKGIANPFGDGRASQRIHEYIANYFRKH